MDLIKIGLDFGTHQTKICVQRIPDEGHGEPNYEFFQFLDLENNKHYVLPSVIQINDDDTLSYGYIDKTRKKPEPGEPIKSDVTLEEEFDLDKMSKSLYAKYATQNNQQEDIHALANMLQLRLQKIKERNRKKLEEAERQYETQLMAHRASKNVFRYFKQATFIGGEWSHLSSISNRTLCIWYLAYVIFLLEEKYGSGFSINMGIPADDVSYDSLKRLAVEILLSSYYLVEDVYKNDLDSFLHEKVEDLLKKTKNIPFSKELKENNYINIFPEAYASLIALTSRGKLPKGMSLTADIGGGTTDISFFIIKDSLPIIYKYWSIPRGLNFVAERSGFDYAEGDFMNKVHQDVIDKFNNKKNEIVSILMKELLRKTKKETNIPVENVKNALKDRVLVYSGGGSTFHFLTKAIHTFTDIRTIDPSIWNEENIKEKALVSKWSVLLTTSYGLALSVSDGDVKLKSLSSIFSHLSKEHEITREEISKDQC